MSEARVDFETRSDVDLKKHGSARYFASPHWKALVMCYSIDGGPIREWTYRDVYCPAGLRAHIAAGGKIRAFNANFERQCFDEMHARFRWPNPKVEQYVCTAVEAAAMALPRSLEAVGAALNLPVQKDKDGERLIKLFSMPVRRLKRHAHLPSGPIFNEPEDHPEDFEKFRLYCRRDVETEAAVAERLMRLPAFEQELYTLDQVINSRGIGIDVKSVRAALAMAEKAKAALEAELLDITFGAVTGVNKAAEMIRWMRLRGVETESVAKDVVLDLLEKDDLPADVRRVLEIRQQGAKSSTAKFEAFLDRVSDDGRVRHAFVMNAASTGRWSSRGVQLHNMPRPRKVFGDAFEEGELDLDVLFKVIRTADPAAVEFIYGPDLGQPLPLLSDSIRSFIRAREDHDLLAADFSGIEDAVGMWDAGETWALEAMAEIIADPSKPDMYRLTAKGIYNEDIAKKDGRRQVGKVARLALGYEGGVAALHAMSRVYALKLQNVFDSVWSSADEERRERAVKRYERCLKRREAKADILPREAWIAGELIKIGYREAHPAVAAGWALRRDAMRDAVATPGTQVKALHCTYLVAHDFLWCKLPSGRCLAYAAPRLKPMVWFRDKTTGERECVPAAEGYAREIDGDGKVEGNAPATVTALGVNSTTLAFQRFGLYGGLATENIVQAIARDLLAHGIVKAERAGYPVIAHVHDEIVTEVRRGFGDVGAFERLICELPAWAEGLPLTASGWKGGRYRK